MKKERCPDYCPFLKKEAFHCYLFDKPLVFDVFLLKCEECLNADVRKNKYKAKVKEFEHRQQMWDMAVKRKPNKVWEQIKVSFADWKERKSMKAFLTALAGDFPVLLDKKTTKLLLNLYLVLDSTEKAIFKDLLSNSKTADLLISSVKGMGPRPDLLNQVRKKMDDIVYQERREKEMMQAEKLAKEAFARQQLAYRDYLGY
ncbi:MAG: hypothetical protein E7013_01470 [Alphaproteobacteria bacterium]|nr:hypothetical protein [Alphaproteobacteria bacterium]